MNAVIVSFIIVDGNWGQLFNNFNNLVLRLKQMFKWDFKNFFEKNRFGESFMNRALMSLLSTFLISISGTIIGTIISLIIAICSSYRVVKNKFINSICISILAILRTIPSFVFSLILIGYFGQSSLTLMISICLFTISITGRLYLEKIEHLNYKVYDSLRATGSTKTNAYIAGVMPEFTWNIFSVMFYAFETNIRYIAIIGGITKVGIGELINNNISLQRWDRVGFLLFLLVLFIVILESLIYLAKNYLLMDKDFIIGKNKEKNIIKKINKIKNMNNLKYYINIKYKFIKKNKQEIKKFKKTHKNNIRVNKLSFNSFIKNEPNIKKWFIYDQYFSIWVRLDKTYVTYFNKEVEILKNIEIESLKEMLVKLKENNKKLITPRYVNSKRPKNWVKRLIFFGIIFILFIYSLTNIKFVIMDKEIINSTNQSIKRIFNIDWKSLFMQTNKVSHSVISLIIETLATAVLGTFIGSLLAYFLGLLSSDTIVNFYVAKIFKFITIIIRAVPTYIYAIIFVSVIGLGPFNGSLAIAMGTMSMLTKYNREVFESINTKLISQLQATGFNFLQKFKYGVIPQTNSNVIAYIIYRFDINFKEVATLGLVGAGTLGYLLNAYFSLRWFEQFGALSFGIILFTFLMEWIAKMMREKIKYNKNPKLIDFIINKIRSLKYINYKFEELMFFKKSTLLFEESRAFYYYSNNEIFKEFKIRKKINNNVKNNELLINCINDYYKSNFKNYSEYKIYKLRVLKNIKNHRKDYLTEIKTTYKNKLKNNKTKFKIQIKELNNKEKVNNFTNEYKKELKNNKYSYKNIKNLLEWDINKYYINFKEL
ncbi:PhnE/PtxC family ABC transporter permease [Spiroplasma litorale]|nr:ABC transporter permease subunit [Spiroplasma litorale]